MKPTKASLLRREHILRRELETLEAALQEPETERPYRAIIIPDVDVADLPSTRATQMRQEYVQQRLAEDEQDVGDTFQRESGWVYEDEKLLALSARVTKAAELRRAHAARYIRELEEARAKAAEEAEETDWRPKSAQNPRPAPSSADARDPRVAGLRRQSAHAQQPERSRAEAKERATWAATVRHPSRQAAPPPPPTEGAVNGAKGKGRTPLRSGSANVKESPSTSAGQPKAFPARHRLQANRRLPTARTVTVPVAQQTAKKAGVSSKASEGKAVAPLPAVPAVAASAALFPPPEGGTGAASLPVHSDEFAGEIVFTEEEEPCPGVYLEDGMPTRSVSSSAPSIAFFVEESTSRDGSVGTPQPAPAQQQHPVAQVEDSTQTSQTSPSPLSPPPRSGSTAPPADAPKTARTTLHRAEPSTATARGEGTRQLPQRAFPADAQPEGGDTTVVTLTPIPSPPPPAEYGNEVASRPSCTAAAPPKEPSVARKAQETRGEPPLREKQGSSEMGLPTPPAVPRTHSSAAQEPESSTDPQHEAPPSNSASFVTIEAVESERRAESGAGAFDVRTPEPGAHRESQPRETVESVDDRRDRARRRRERAAAASQAELLRRYRSDVHVDQRRLAVFTPEASDEELWRQLSASRGTPDPSLGSVQSIATSHLWQQVNAEAPLVPDGATNGGSASQPVSAVVRDTDSAVRAPYGTQRRFPGQYVEPTFTDWCAPAVEAKTANTHPHTRQPESHSTSTVASSYSTNDSSHSSRQRRARGLPLSVIENEFHASRVRTPNATQISANLTLGSLSQDPLESVEVPQLQESSAPLPHISTAATSALLSPAPTNSPSVRTATTQGAPSPEMSVPTTARDTSSLGEETSHSRQRISPERASQRYPERVPAPSDEVVGRLFSPKTEETPAPPAATTAPGEATLPGQGKQRATAVVESAAGTVSRLERPTTAVQRDGLPRPSRAQLPPRPTPRASWLTDGAPVALISFAPPPTGGDGSEKSMVAAMQATPDRATAERRLTATAEGSVCTSTPFASPAAKPPPTEEELPRRWSASFGSQPCFFDREMGSLAPGSPQQHAPTPLLTGSRHSPPPRHSRPSSATAPVVDDGVRISCGPTTLCKELPAPPAPPSPTQSPPQFVTKSTQSTLSAVPPSGEPDGATRAWLPTWTQRADEVDGASPPALPPVAPVSTSESKPHDLFSDTSSSFVRSSVTQSASRQQAPSAPRGDVAEAEHYLYELGQVPTKEDRVLEDAVGATSSLPPQGSAPSLPVKDVAAAVVAALTLPLAARHTDPGSSQLPVPGQSAAVRKRDNDLLFDVQPLSLTQEVRLLPTPVVHSLMAEERPPSPLPSDVVVGSPMQTADLNMSSSSPPEPFRMSASPLFSDGGRNGEMEQVMGTPKAEISATKVLYYHRDL